MVGILWCCCGYAAASGLGHHGVSSCGAHIDLPLHRPGAQVWLHAEASSIPALLGLCRHCCHLRWLAVYALALASAYDVGVDELRIMHEGLLTTADVGVQLNTSCAEFREHVNAMPATCKHSLAEAGMSGFVDLGHHATSSKFEDFIKVTRTMMVVAKLSGWLWRS